MQCALAPVEVTVGGGVGRYSGGVCYEGLREKRPIWGELNLGGQGGRGSEGRGKKPG